MFSVGLETDGPLHFSNGWNKSSLSSCFGSYCIYVYSRVATTRLFRSMPDRPHHATKFSPNLFSRKFRRFFFFLGFIEFFRKWHSFFWRWIQYSILSTNCLNFYRFFAFSIFSLSSSSSLLHFFEDFGTNFVAKEFLFFLKFLIIDRKDIAFVDFFFFNTDSSDAKI